jgi:hypothetical protein
MSYLRLFFACSFLVLAAAPFASAQSTNTNWSAFDDFYVNVPATGGNGDYNQSTWIANAGVWPFDTGLTNPNAWGYAGVNLNGFGFPTSVGTYVAPSSGGVYPFTSGGAYAGSGVSYYLGGSNYYIGYNSTYGPISQIGKYTQEWFGGAPNYANNPGGTNNKYLWVQSTGLGATTDGLGAMVTWTAPTSGTYTFNGSYVNGNAGGLSTDFAIVDSKNNVALPKLTLSANSSVGTYNFNRVYKAGDVVQFQVGTPAAAQGSPLGLEANISKVSQPVGTTWNAYSDFYLTPTASGWSGATSPSAKGAAFGYYAANVNGGGFASQIGSFFTPSASGAGSQSMYQYSTMAPNGAGTLVGSSAWVNTGGSGFAYYADTNGWGSSLGSYQTPWFGGAPGLSQSLTNLIWMQPGWLSGEATEGIAPVVTWTAPESGYYTLTGQFVSGNQPANGASVAIVAGLNNTQSALELARTVLGNNSFQTFDFTRFYEAGTVVQFQAGSSFTTGNAVGLQLNITAIPEPSTIIAAIGLLGFMLWPAARRYLWRNAEKKAF